MPRCSIVIPAYNVESFVGQAIESALAQSYRDTEVIVVNDGSTDGTAAAIDPFLGRITCLEQPNRGPSAARNRALRESTGEYVAMLDADDFWLPHRLARMVAYLEDHPEFGFATSDAFLFNDSEPPSETYYGHVKRHAGMRFHADDQLYWILQYNFIYAAAVVRRELFERYGNFDESVRTCEDWDLWIRFITAGERAGLLAEPLANYRVRRGSLSYDRARLYRDALTILERALVSPAVKAVPGLAGSVFFTQGAHALAQGDHKAAKRYFTEAADDPALPLIRRLKARAAATLPRAAWKFRNLKFRPKRERVAAP
jgi:glycosyltransferase involved in cell wall biosynthesis